MAFDALTANVIVTLPRKCAPMVAWLTLVCYSLPWKQHRTFVLLFNCRHAILKTLPAESYDTMVNGHV